MKKLYSKLRSRRGETLTEMLVSILILGLSISLMVTMIVVSTRMTEQAAAADDDYQKQLSAAEAQDGTGTDGEVHITKDGVTVDIDVSIYGEENGLKSYKIK